MTPVSPDPTPVVPPAAPLAGESAPDETTAPPPNAANDDSLARYEIGELLAVGGLGEVYRAWDRHLRRRVALKRILTVGPGAAFAQEAAGKEAMHLAALQHPNIVTVHDFGRDAQGPYVVMELVEGETLESVASRAAFPLTDFLRLARESLDALSAAHAIGMLHRDLKPGNLMLKWGGATSTFQVKLLDFGLSKISEKPQTQTRLIDNSVFGSIHFMAPEQFEGKPFDQRTDLYALGCLFYYALTRQNPFRGDTVAEVMNAHLQHHFTSLAVLRPDLPPTLAGWVEKLFALKPDDRFQTAADALQQLEQAATSATAPVPLPRPSMRPAVVGGAIAAGALVTALWFLVIHPRVTGPSPEADSARFRGVVPAAPAAPESAAVGSILRPDEANKIYDAADLVGLRERLGQNVVVQGVLVGQNDSRTGNVRFLNFGNDYRTSLSLVFMQADVRKDATTARLRTFVGKKVRAEGILAEREGALRVMIENEKALTLVP